MITAKEFVEQIQYGVKNGGLLRGFTVNQACKSLGIIESIGFRALEVFLEVDNLHYIDFNVPQKDGEMLCRGVGRLVVAGEPADVVDKAIALIDDRIIIKRHGKGESL